MVLPRLPRPNGSRKKALATRLRERAEGPVHHGYFKSFDGTKLWIPFEDAPRTGQGPRRWPTSARGEPAGDGRGHDRSDELDAEPAAARALLTVGGNLWAGTSKGIWPVTGPDGAKVLDQTTGLLDSDVVGMKFDRFGRLWVLGHLGLTVTDTFPVR